MEDLIFYSRNDSGLANLLKTVKGFSDHTGMECSLDKCAKATISRGSLRQTFSIILDTRVTMKYLEEEGEV